MHGTQACHILPAHESHWFHQPNNVHHCKANTPSIGTFDPIQSAEADRILPISSDPNAYCPQEQVEQKSPQEEQDPRNRPLWMADHSPTFPQLLLARSVGRTPRLKYLISYYIEVIAPVIVAFDSSTNPFRTHILRLAEESESLQEAIATLSTSNLKQRRQAKTIATGRTLPSRMSSLALRALTENTSEDHRDLPTLEELAREEQLHRGRAVRALNADLADPHRRLSDSVLATLLVLCLFHICDTGVARFQTQFAGVKKILAIRMRAGTADTDMKWFVRLFTWLDTLTASTNDREAQFGGTCLDITALSDEKWCLENLTGCDSSLFKLVAQLGRLNLLSQNQVVGTPLASDLQASTTALPPSMLELTHVVGLPASRPTDAYRIPKSMPLLASDQSRQCLPSAFWTEWFSLRQKLETWRISTWGNESVFPSQHDAPRVTSHAYTWPPSSPNSQHHIAPQNLSDVYNISESFRHSAILYCERLAHPDLSPSHPRIQSIVETVIRHMSAVQSDVFLLWPLFITGSECVLEEHRQMIRSRCTDICKDSGFFNNLSCLQLLENIWATSSIGPRNGTVEAAAGSTPLHTSGEGVFRWSRVMQTKRADGEYIVV